MIDELCAQWALRFIFLLLQLGPILRYVDSLVYGVKFLKSKPNSRERRKYYEYMVYEVICKLLFYFCNLALA